MTTLLLSSSAAMSPKVLDLSTEEGRSGSWEELDNDDSLPSFEKTALGAEDKEFWNVLLYSVLWVRFGDTGVLFSTSGSSKLKKPVEVVL